MEERSARECRDYLSRIGLLSPEDLQYRTILTGDHQVSEDGRNWFTVVVYRKDEGYGLVPFRPVVGAEARSSLKVELGIENLINIEPDGGGGFEPGEGDEDGTAPLLEWVEEGPTDYFLRKIVSAELALITYGKDEIGYWVSLSRTNAAKYYIDEYGQARNEKGSKTKLPNI